MYNGDLLRRRPPCRGVPQQTATFEPTPGGGGGRGVASNDDDDDDGDHVHEAEMDHCEEFKSPAQVAIKCGWRCISRGGGV